MTLKLLIKYIYILPLLLYQYVFSYIHSNKVKSIASLL